MKRRKFIHQSTSTLAGVGLLGLSACNSSNPKEQTSEKNPSPPSSDQKPAYKISLAQWSLHNSLFEEKITNLDFARIAREEFDIDAIEYVNVFFKDKAKNTQYLDQLNRIASDYNVYQNLIMVDGEGGMAHLDDSKRNEAIDNHRKWLDAAKHLNCATIRVNAYGEGSMEDVQLAAIDGLGKLAEIAQTYDLNVVVENHGGYSSNGKWLAEIMRQINMPNCGTLPDFGNFCIKFEDRKCIEEYDRYLGVEELMPYAHAVSAKTFQFDNQGNPIETDYYKMMDIVLKAGYSGYVGIEYEGVQVDEYTGIRATQKILQKLAQPKG